MDMMGSVTNERMQVNICSVLLVAHKVALEPMARFAPDSTESFGGQWFSWCLRLSVTVGRWFDNIKVQRGLEQVRERQDKTLLATARQY